MGNVNGLIGLYIFLIITIPSVLAGAFVFRGKFYKGVVDRLDKVEKENQDLRDRDTKNYTEMRRLRTENDNLTKLVTGTKQLEEIIEILRQHDSEAAKRHYGMMTTLTEIKAAQAARDHGVSG